MIRIKNIYSFILVFALLFTLPMDWFSPTALLFREAGSKPACVILMIISLCELLHLIYIKKGLNFPIKLFNYYLTILYLGTLGFLISILFYKLDFSYYKNPLVQFVGQAGLFVLSFTSLFCLTSFLKRKKISYLFIYLVPIVALVHLVFFNLDLMGVIDFEIIPFSLFRIEGNSMLGRVCGLMSEPSYFGAFAALFGLPLLLMKSYYRLRYRLLGIFLLVAAVFAQAKTMFIVIFFQLIILFIYTKNFNFKKIFIVFGALFVFGLLYLISVGQNINVNENLSAAMRFGSTILGFNVASQGYAITGLGFGQFHFYYNPQFAPNFLLLSDEANYQFQSHAETRASTYNFFIRILVEAGILGFLVCCKSLSFILNKVRYSNDEQSMLGLLFLSGSIGFLMTQDTYFYPPFVMGCSLILSSGKLEKSQRQVLG